MASLLYGVGINDADYLISVKQGDKEWRCPFYTRWKNMLARCYSPAFQRNQPLYVGCTVDPRWHSFMNFKAWMEQQEHEGKQLDKDRRVAGNKVYGPDTCEFLSRKQNIQARSVTLFATYKGFWVNLWDFYSGDTSAYTYARGKLDTTSSIEEIERMRAAELPGKMVDDHANRDTSKLHTIDGVTKSRVEWIKHYGSSEIRCSENQSKYKLSFEDAVKLPVQRGSKVSVNGSVMRVSKMWEKFGVNGRAANTKKARQGWTHVDTLRYFGVDTEGFVIEPI